MASRRPCPCSAHWCAKRMSSTAIITFAGSRNFWPVAGWRDSGRTSRQRRQRDRVLDRHLVEIADQDFDAERPAAGDRNAQIVDPPVRLARSPCDPPHGLDPGGGIGQYQRDLLGRERPKRAVEQ